MYTLNKEEVPSITSLQASAMHLQLGHKYRYLPFYIFALVFDLALIRVV